MPKVVRESNLDSLSATTLTATVLHAERQIYPIITSPSGSVAVNATAAIVASDLRTGYITSTSGAAVTLTLPATVEIVAEFDLKAGQSVEFMVDNTLGSNAVTVTAASGTTSFTTATGGSVAAVAANDVGIFRLTCEFNGTSIMVARIG